MRSGLIEVVDVLRGVEGISFVQFDDRDVVRHSLVQKIVKAYERYNEADRRQPPVVAETDRPGRRGGADGSTRGRIAAPPEACRPMSPDDIPLLFHTSPQTSAANRACATFFGAIVAARRARPDHHLPDHGRSRAAALEPAVSRRRITRPTCSRFPLDERRRYRDFARSRRGTGRASTATPSPTNCAS